MFSYDYIEPLQTRMGENPAYRLAEDLIYWINKELEKRREQLEIKESIPIAIYLTMRKFRKNPVFVLGSQQEDGVKILEAWHFRMTPNPNEGQLGLQLVLDRVALKALFPEYMTPVKKEPTDKPDPFEEPAF